MLATPHWRWLAPGRGGPRRPGTSPSPPCHHREMCGSSPGRERPVNAVLRAARRDPPGVVASSYAGRRQLPTKPTGDGLGESDGADGGAGLPGLIVTTVPICTTLTNVCPAVRVTGVPSGP